MGGGVERCGQSACGRVPHSQGIMGYDVTSLGLLCFPLLTLALFGVCGCLAGCGLANLAFVDMFLLRAKTGNFY